VQVSWTRSPTSAIRRRHLAASDNGAFATSGSLAAGATYTVNLTKAGTYQYHCAIHPNMVGTITVTQ
jgi:plastocyanin